MFLHGAAGLLETRDPSQGPGTLTTLYGVNDLL